MTRTEELLKLAEAAEPYWYGPINGPVQDFVDEVTPPLLKQLVELCRLQHEALELASMRLESALVENAITAFERFEKGGE